MSTPDPKDLLQVRLVAVRYAARDINLYEFRRLDGGKLPAVEPGAHVDLHLPNGIVRQYSLTNPDAEPTSYVLGIKLDEASRGGSRYIFSELKVGDVVKISPPRNNFPLIAGEGPVVLIAGGIGITPIYAMAQSLKRDGRSFELHYSCRSRSAAALLEQLDALGACTLHVDDESDGRHLDLAGIVQKAAPGADFYCCGPTPMLEAFEQATADIDPARVHVEYFSAKQVSHLDDGSFVVALNRTGGEYVIPPDQTILSVLRDAGLDLPFSCEEGICGACETTVLSGIPDHRDLILTSGAGETHKTMMICCSRSRSDRLVLDI